MDRMMYATTIPPVEGEVHGERESSHPTDNRTSKKLLTSFPILCWENINWNALSYHRVREAIAGGWLRFEHIPGTENPADVLTKSLAWNVLKTYIEPLLFWKGETSDAPSGSPNPEGSITGPGHETPLASGMSTNVSVDVNSCHHNLIVDVDANHHDPEQDQDQPAFNRLWNNQYAVLTELDM
eukprot:scaffold609_cov170-Amphora_coffeaeformis.AAC.10